MRRALNLRTPDAADARCAMHDCLREMTARAFMRIEMMPISIMLPDLRSVAIFAHAASRPEMRRLLISGAISAYQTRQ